MKKPIKKELRRGTRLYSIWSHMRQRVRDENVDRYAHYGGKGVTVCEEWQDYEVFKSWALENGYSKELSIDRIDNDGNYEPSNCRWATLRQQMNNTSRNHFVEHNGERKTLAQWGRKLGITREAVHNRLYVYGWSKEQALTTPKLNNGQTIKGVDL